MSPTLVTQNLFIDFVFSEQEGRTHIRTVHISYVLATYGQTAVHFELQASLNEHAVTVRHLSCNLFVS